MAAFMEQIKGSVQQTMQEELRPLKEEVDSLRRDHTGLERRVQALERRAVSPAASRQSWSGSSASTTASLNARESTGASPLALLK
eukprot:4586389-Lingulodinium_polyedra.AAC.1